MTRYEQAVAAIRGPLPSNPDLKDLVRFATLAANAHNTQPWKFRLRPNEIEILPDFSRRTPIVDPDDHHLYATLGCAAENLVIAGSASGRPVAVSLEERGSEGTVIRASIGQGARSDEDLCRAIPLRQSTKSEYDGQPVSSKDREALKAAACMPGVEAIFIAERDRMENALGFIQKGNSAQFNDPDFIRELKSWIRFSKATAIGTGDGLSGPCSGSPNAPDWLGPILFDLMFKEKAENRKLEKQIRSSAGLVVFLAEDESPRGWIQAGRCFERFALRATALEIRHAHVNMPVEVPAIRPAFAEWLGRPGQRPDLVIRFGKAAARPMSMRRPVDDVIVSGGEQI